MSREERTNLLYRIVGTLWMMLNHRHASLRFGRLHSLVQDAFSCYQKKLEALSMTPQCLSCEQLHEKGFLKKRHWKSAAYMASATSLPVLYKQVDYNSILEAVCAKASIGSSAKLMDNLNDEVHSYKEARNSLRTYESALGHGFYEPGDSPFVTAERSAHEMATWVYETVSSHGPTTVFRKDVALLVSGQVASLEHKKGKYPSMKEYLSRICERSIGNVWIDVDLAFLDDEEPQIKEGNDHIFKSYLIYDDVQDIVRDLRNNSVNAAVILGLERGILDESDMKESPDIIEILEKSGIFQDLLLLGDLVFLRGVELISSNGRNPIDKKGLAASLGMIRMFNIRRFLAEKRNAPILEMFFASEKKLEKVKVNAPEYIEEMAEHIS